jgi:hypothetical protein
MNKMNEEIEDMHSRDRQQEMKIGRLQSQIEDANLTRDRLQKELNELQQRVSLSRLENLDAENSHLRKLAEKVCYACFNW